MQSMYFILFDMLKEYIYGAETVLTGDMELTLTICSTLGALFVVAIPFLIAWRFIKLFL